MDYLDAMLDAQCEELKRWHTKEDYFEDVFEVRRDDCLMVKKPGHLSFETAREDYFRMRNRAAMEAAYSAAKDHSPELNLRGWCSENLYIKKQEKPKVDWLALNRDVSGC